MRYEYITYLHWHYGELYESYTVSQFFLVATPIMHEASYHAYVVGGMPNIDQKELMMDC